MNSIPGGDRPSRDQPYYHPLAENSETSYIAYVSEQNLLVDESGQTESHPQVGYFFSTKSQTVTILRAAPKRSILYRFNSLTFTLPSV